MRVFRGVVFLGLPLLGVPHAHGQEPTSRAEQWRQAREEKSKDLVPDELSKTEVTLNKIRDKRIIERIVGPVSGFRVRLGGLATSQGFAIGPEYNRPELAHGRLRFRTSLRGAASGAVLADLGIAAPRLAGDKAFVELYSAYRNFPRIDYYGPGPESERGNRTSFRSETVAYDVTFGATLFPHFQFGTSGGFLQANTGPGNRDGVPRTEELFTDATTPSLTNQSDFLRGGFFAHYDYRDNPGGPRTGGSYRAQVLTYDDRTLGRHGFRRLELEAQQYFPFYNKRRVVALRVLTLMSFTGTGRTVPFYLQPTLGGSDDLRGFRAYRFYDDNAIVANAEYRWESFAGLDAALFFDAGKVTSKRSQINFHDLEASAGFGLRFNIRNNVFLRVDVGAGREGAHVWLKFRNSF